jgi:DnaJ-class molecular chaperone
MTCPTCHGTGHPRWIKADTCSTCQGAGEICRFCDVPAEYNGQDLCPACKLEEDERNQVHEEPEDE